MVRGQDARFVPIHIVDLQNDILKEKDGQCLFSRGPVSKKTAKFLLNSFNGNDSCSNLKLGDHGN